jgi:uncharacterized protein YgiM (DUF1202 family)
MENWKHIGGLLTGVAAIITASIPIFSYLKSDIAKNTIATKIQKEQQVMPVTQIKQYAVISDPDGWVNLRVSPNINSKIIKKIENGYRVHFLDKSGNWSKVQTDIGEIGFIYSDRLNFK